MRNVKLLWGIIVVLAIVVFTLAVRSLGDVGPRAAKPAPSTGDSDRVIAKIGDREIRSGALTGKLYDRHGADLLSEMLDREAIRMEADAAGIKVDRAEIDDELKRMQQGYDNEDQFYRAMKDQLSMTKDQLREDVLFKLLLDKIAVVGILVSDADVEAYIRGHPEEFKNTVQLHLLQIVNDSLEQADRTIELAQQGRNFGGLAQERSLDAATAGDGGDLGWIDEDDPFVSVSILKAAKTMKPGDISKPIHEGEEYIVVKLQDRKENRIGTPEEIRRLVRKRLELQQAPPVKDVTAKLRQKYNAAILDPALQR